MTDFVFEHPPDPPRGDGWDALRELRAALVARFETDKLRLAPLEERKAYNAACDNHATIVFKMIGDLLAAAPKLAPAESPAFDMLAHLRRQREWSERTFGPGSRAAGVVDHIRKELDEIASAPGDIEEWIDVVILALDGAWRSGASPEAIVAQLVAKQTKNEGRSWPDWRTADPNAAIQHVKPAESPAEPAQDDDYRSLDHACEILRGCVAPYSGEQAQKVAVVLKQWHDKWAAAVDCIHPDERQTIADLRAKLAAETERADRMERAAKREAMGDG